MQPFTDQLNRKISLPEFPPKKIVSLVPSITELLYDLGLEKEISGITKFCVHPGHAKKDKPIIGGTKNFHIEKIETLAPDLIIANKEENLKSQVDALQTKFPVWISDVESFVSAMQLIQGVGAVTGKDKEAAKLIQAIETAFSTIPVSGKKYRVTYLIWQNPLMTIGGDTFIQVMLEKAGLENVFKEKARYPEISVEDIRDSGTEILLLSSEPYPFGEKHVPYFQEALPGIKILLADGEMFSWYGSRMVAAAAYFKDLQKRISLLVKD